MARAQRGSPFAVAARSPLLWLAAGLMIGQGIGGSRWAVPRGARAAAAALGCGCLALARARPAGWALLAAALGFQQAHRALQPPTDPEHVARYAGRTVWLRALVAEPAVRSQQSTRVVLEALAVGRGGGQRVRGRVLLTVAKPRRNWALGAVVEGPLRLRRPRNFGNPGEFDYEGYLARREIFVTAFLYSDEAVAERVGRGPSRVQALRERIGTAFRSRLESPQREILAALVLGDRGGISQELREKFAIAGVSHLLAISGLHVGMVWAGAFFGSWWLLGRSRTLLLRWGLPRLCAAASFGPVLGYAALAGWGVATQRAVLMLAVVVVAVVVERQRDALLAVAAAALAIGAVWPASVLEVSFQLSFVSVIGLLLGMTRFWFWWRSYSERRLLFLRPRLRAVLRVLLGSLAVTVCAQAATAPLTAFHFNRVSWVGVVANPLVVPLLGTAGVGFGLVAAVGALFGEPLFAPASAVAGAAVKAGVAIAVWLAGIPGADWRVPTPSLAELVLAYALLGALACLHGRRRGAVCGLALVLLAGDFAAAARARWWRPALQVSFLSVGQGDCAVVRFPGSAVMVVDGGGLVGIDVGERVIAPYLWREKIGRVDFVVLTHPQYDHYGGLGFLARQFAPREFWHTGEGSEAPSYLGFRAVLEERGVRDWIVRAGLSRSVGRCSVSILGPPARRERLATNDASVALRIECGAASVLLPGDMERAGEQEVIRAGAPLRSRVLKVPHHGSATSSSGAFLDRVRPQIAVVSAGFENRFGFPDPRVLAALQTRGARTFVTAEDGAVTVDAGEGGALRVRTWRSRRSVLVRPGG